MFHASKRKSTAFVLQSALICFVFVLAAQTAHADTIYTYTGSDFTHYYNGSWHPFALCPTPDCNVTGSFTLATALGDNLNNVAITPESYSFTDGLSTNTDANSVVNTFNVSTDANGNITAWTIYTQINPNHSPCSQNEYTVYTSNTGDSGEISGDLCTSPYDQYANNAVGGTWAETSTATPTPEPASLALLGSGLIGIGGFARRRFFS